MKKTIITGKKIITSQGLVNGYVEVDDGKIAGVHIGVCPNFKDAKLIEAGDLFVSPGFIDIHTHGAGGHDFMDGSVECILGAARKHLEHGTTTIVPTTLTSTLEELFQTIDNFKTAQMQIKNGPYLLGLHLEGPYFSMEQRGAQDPQYIKNPNRDEYKKILEYADRAVVRWSVAVELDGALEMGDYLKEKGIVASIGHSDAEYYQVTEAFKHGYSLLTHFYSAMSTIVRKGGFRHLGVVESGYIIDDMDVEIIADGCHLPTELLQMICKLKGCDRIALVTDSMRGAGMPDGESILGSLKNGQPVIIEDGVAKLVNRSAFAGSVATADRLIRVMYKNAKVDICSTVKMMSQNPARIMNIQDHKGSIAPGMDADIVLFDDNITIKKVIFAGVEVF
ncbi:MAG: N-acetylglucosamine-6-phosphate deacetylase [Clostridia bacterium BRH_c25]|nr:MAG: N-acetylglucosamine-6-phosphate deacetylase [Clostridia bacterium BRH_c25]